MYTCISFIRFLSIVKLYRHIYVARVYLNIVVSCCNLSNIVTGTTVRTLNYKNEASVRIV